MWTVTALVLDFVLLTTTTLFTKVSRPYFLIEGTCEKFSMEKRLEVLSSIRVVNNNFWNTQYITERWAGPQCDGNGAILQSTGSAGTNRDPGGEDATGQVKGHHQLHTGERGSSDSIPISLCSICFSLFRILFHCWSVHFHSCMPYLVLIWSHSQSLYKYTHTLISANGLWVILNLNWRPIDWKSMAYL